MTTRKGPGGLPEHIPTDEQRAEVMRHSKVGTPQETIADIIGIDAKTLRKHYRAELDHSTACANADIGGALYKKAMDGDTAAMIFWLKTRARWSEKTEIDHTSSDGTMTPKESGAAVLDALQRKYANASTDS